MFRELNCVLSPGPVTIPRFLKLELLKDPPYFASRKFSSVLSYVTEELQKLFHSENRVMIGTGSGSLGMEVTVHNCFNESESVLVISHGKYGDNWAKICKNRNLKTTTCRRTNRAIYPSEIKKLLSENKDIDGVFITHVETTTGIRAPLNDYIEAIRSANDDALIIVDAVSSLITEPLDASKCDVVISASQKALCCPPGLFFVSYSNRVKEKIWKVGNVPLYFDFKNEIDRTNRSITTYTPAVHVVMCLKRMLLYLSRLGLDNVRKTIEEHSKYCKRLFHDHGFLIHPFLTEDRSNAVTVVNCRSGGNAIVDKLESIGIYIGRGLGEFDDQLFRIGHFSYYHILNEKDNIDQMYKAIINVALESQRSTSWVKLKEKN